MIFLISFINLWGQQQTSVALKRFHFLAKLGEESKEEVNFVMRA